MKNSQFTRSFLAFALLANLWSCGDDDDQSDGSASGGSSGAAAGTSSGGAPEGGSSTAGATSSSGGAGFADAGADAGGAAGSGAEVTLEAACEKICADQSALVCAFDECAELCVNLAGDSIAPDGYLAMLRCQAEQLGASDYACLSMAPDPLDWPAPVAGTRCEPIICDWYCGEETLLGNYAVYLRCGCGG